MHDKKKKQFDIENNFADLIDYPEHSYKVYLFFKGK